ncbi:asparagine synthase (glutamine-hydrolyzing), partial [Candidatus Parcubacteria bacterium]
EIYNYRELRSELESRGHRFRTQTDTEVLVHLYEERGTDFLKHLNGMFAIALWDARKAQLLLARDRLGIKPLYTAVVGDILIFASELKAILQHPEVSRQLDTTAIAEYLTYEYIPAPRTAFAGVKKLCPATYAIWRDGQLKVHTYWDVAFQADESLRDEGVCAEAIRERLSESVRLRLRADVPIGVLLSGGMDSSSIVAAMHHLNVPINTFSIGFAEREYDELDAATAVARAFGARHHALRLSAPDVIRLLPAIIGVLDEPLADASVVPTFLVSKLARQHVKVALSGDGGDETFGGYETYRAHKLARVYRRLPRLVQAGVRLGVEVLPVSRSHRGLSFKARKFASGASFRPAVANALWWGAYTPEQRTAILGPAVRGGNGCERFEAVRRVEERFKGSELLDLIAYCDLKLYLQDDLLVKVDRMSMANSLEVRVPFLDHEMVEFAATIPACLRIRGLRLKHMLKKAMEPWLPRGIAARPKRGFDIPLDAWMRGPLREFVYDTLRGASIIRDGLINGEMVETLIEDHMRKRRNNRQLLWPLIVLESWRQRYG